MNWYRPQDNSRARSRSHYRSPRLEATLTGASAHNLKAMRFAKDAEEIRSLKSQGWSYSMLAQKYQASTETLYRVVKRKGLYGRDLSLYANFI